MSLYVTPTQIKLHLDITAENRKYDQQLYGICQAVTKLIEQTTNQYYFPAIRTLIQVLPGGTWLTEPLLEIQSVVNELGDEIEYSIEGYPIHYVEVAEEVEITGIWGYHSSYQDAWLDSLDSLQADVLESDSEILVEDAGGPTILGFFPRFEQGQLIKIDDEYLSILHIDSSLWVERGQGYTEAAGHVTGSKIYSWNVEPLVQQAALIQAIRLFKRGQQAYQDASASVELGQLIYTRKLDPDVAYMLQGLREPVFA